MRNTELKHLSSAHPRLGLESDRNPQYYVAKILVCWYACPAVHDFALVSPTKSLNEISCLVQHQYLGICKNKLYSTTAQALVVHIACAGSPCGAWPILCRRNEHIQPTRRRHLAEHRPALVWRVPHCANIVRRVKGIVVYSCRGGAQERTVLGRSRGIIGGVEVVLDVFYPETFEERL